MHQTGQEATRGAAGIGVSARIRLQGGVVRTISALPRSAQRALAGPPKVVDGQELDPEIQILLRLLDRGSGPSQQLESVPEARLERAREAHVFAGHRFAVAAVEEVELPGPAGSLKARMYVPHFGGRTPLLVYLHGGGWVVCDLDTHDNVCRFLAREGGVRVLSIEYRLAPEHPFPAAVEDAFAALRFAHDNAARLGAAPDAIAIGGDSAGGNLAAVVSRLAAADGGPAPAFVLSIYPVTDLSTKHPSYALFGDGYALTEAQMDWYRRHYLPDEAAALDPRASPLLADDLAGLPPTYVATAGFDPLRDEGEAYASRLREAGVPVALRRHPGLVHGFVNAAGSTRFARAAMHELAGALRMGLATAPLEARVQ
jgi:acetyl esterase